MTQPKAKTKECQWCGAATAYDLCAKCERESDEAWDDYSLSPEEEDAAIEAYENAQARREWEHYHPDDPCPEIELPHPNPERLARQEDSGADNSQQDASQPQANRGQS